MHLLVILILSFFLRLYKLNTLMAFGGDIAYDFLAAKDVIFQVNFPLVGIASSVPWLRQSAFFAYLIAPILWLGRFNPVVIGYFAAVTGTLGVWAVYRLGSKMFSESAGFWAALFYSFSPLIILFDRYPYHQNPISLLTIILFFSIYLSLKKINYLFWSFFLFGLLLQFELSNLVLLPVFLYPIRKKRQQLKLKYLFLCFLLFLIPWIPKFIYDINHGFSQTFGFLAWVIHKLPPINWLFDQNDVHLSMPDRIALIGDFWAKIILWRQPLLSFLLLITAGISAVKEKLLLLWLVIPIAGFILQGSPSEAYVPVLFGGVAIAFGYLASQKKGFAIILICLAFWNAFTLLKNNFFLLNGPQTEILKQYNRGQSYKLQQEIARYIVAGADGEEYNLKAIGSFAHYPNAKLNYDYLTWYLGNGPVESKENLIYFVYDNSDGITIRDALQTKKFAYQSVSQVRRHD